jgi:membrane dipeptidase
MDANELHFDSTVVDLHCHSAIKASIFHRNMGSAKEKFLMGLFKRKFWPLANRTTFPRLVEGGLDVMLSTAFIPEGGWYEDMSLAKWLIKLAPNVRKEIYEASYFDATMSVLDEMEAQATEWNQNPNNRKIAVCKSVSDLDKALEDGSLALVHSVEGAHSNLEQFYNKGVAYLTLAHFYENDCAPPVFPWPEYALSHGSWESLLSKWDEDKSLTDIGEAVVEKMFELGMLLDISHCTLKARRRIYEIADHHNAGECIFASHVGAFEVNRLSYNLQDWELKWLADRGGVAGIIFMNYWISPVDTQLGLKYIEQTIDHIINVAGSDVPAIGTDFDGFTDPPDEIIHMGQLPRITSHLKAVGWDDHTIKKFLGGNSMRLLRNGWKK